MFAFAQRVLIKIHVLPRKIVLIAVQDSGNNYIGRKAPGQLRRLGGSIRRARVGLRASYALVGYTKRGRKPKWVKEVTRPKGRGPSIINVKIPLIPQSRSKCMML